MSNLSSLLLVNQNEDVEITKVNKEYHKLNDKSTYTQNSEEKQI